MNISIEEATSMKRGTIMDRLLQEITHWVKTSDKRIIIGISGHGAAGKTTFAHKLMKKLDKDSVNYLNTDPYIIDSEVRRNAIIEYTYENKHHQFKMTACHPAAHHLPSLERDIQMVRNGLDLWTIDTHYLETKHLSAQKEITIVEGMSVAFIDPKIFDRMVYFYTDSETEFKRRSTRDIEERGRDIESLRQSHDERRIQYELFMHPYSEHFDVIIKSVNGATRIARNLLNDKSE